MQNSFLEYGLHGQIELIGKVSKIRIVENSPIVFLIDENHDNPNDCFGKNIINASELIDKANVVLVGVESHSGGQEWDQIEECYLDEYYYMPVSESNRTNTCPEFAYSLAKNYPSIVYGIESFGILSKIEVDYEVGHQRAINTEVRDHVFHKARSRHFIKTLFDTKLNYRLEGNLILSCGSDHNSHIEEWIKNGEIDEISGFKASYIRLNSYE